MRRVMALLVLGWTASAVGAQELPTCERAAELVVPSSSELAAESIPWRPSFREGVLEADRKDRPVLLWAMNGHPLGCT